MLYRPQVLPLEAPCAGATCGLPDHPPGKPGDKSLSTWALRRVQLSGRQRRHPGKKLRGISSIRQHQFRGTRQAQVKLVDGSNHALDGKPRSNESSPILAELVRQSGIRGQLFDPRAQALSVACLNKKTGLTIEADFRGAITII